LQANASTNQLQRQEIERKCKSLAWIRAFA